MTLSEAPRAGARGISDKWHSYTRGERIADGTLHILGLSAGISACVTLFLANSGASALGAVAIGLYAAGLLTMLGCSALYNLTQGGRAKAVFRRLDHAAIFAMIAGTYTPISILGIGGVWGWCLVAAVWAGALAGSVLKLAAPGRFEGASVVAYLLLGWAGLVAIAPLTASLPSRAIMLIALGGAFYSTGVLLHLATRIRYHNALWHACVLAGAGSHFAVVYGLAARTAS